MTPTRPAGRAAAPALAAVALVAASVAAAPPIEADPKLLVVQPHELPVSFGLRGGDYQPGGGYAAIYFRPEVLAAAPGAESGLLGVLAAVEVHADAAVATREFAARRRAEDIRGALGGAEQAAVLERVDELAGDLDDLDDVDQSVAFRVEYALQGVAVVDYRYRLRVANVVANLMVTSRLAADGGEEAAMADTARRIAVAQAARIAGARPSA